MRRSLYLLAISLFLIAAPVLAPGVAGAGGPTSALLVSPSTGATGAIYYSDDEYQDLFALIGAGSAGPTPATTGSSGAARTGRGNEIRTNTYVTITWMIHDVTVWRIDQVYFSGGEPSLIRTQQSDDFGTLQAGPFDPEAGQLHSPSQPELLGALLDRLLSGPAVAGVGSGGIEHSESAPAESAPAESAPAESAPAESEPGGTAPTQAMATESSAAPAVVAGGTPPTTPAVGHWGWAGAGLLVGAIGCLLALLAVQWWRRRVSADDADPRPRPVIMLPD